MTTHEILKLEAGPKLDRLILEKVYNAQISWWSVHPWNWQNGRHTPPGVIGTDWRRFSPSEVLFPDNKGDWPDLEYRYGNGDWQGDIPAYSTEFHLAWDLISAITDPDQPEGKIVRIEGPFQDGWKAEYIWLHHDGDLFLAGVTCETVPLALCQLALLVKEQQFGQFTPPPEIGFGLSE